jgi:hypothetical protein
MTALTLPVISSAVSVLVLLTAFADFAAATIGALTAFIGLLTALVEFVAAIIGLLTAVIGLILTRWRFHRTGSQ